MAQMIDMLGAETGREYGMADQMADMVNENLDRNGGAPRAIGSTNIDLDKGESSITAKARQQAAETTRPM